MATSYTHAVVGLGMARLYTGRPMSWAYWTLAALLATIPDIDVLSTASYGTPLGHRGITHSLLGALVLGLAVAGIVYRRFRFPWWSLAALFFATLASHDLLDAMTWGGEGIPFFWPFGGRYGNWGLIPAANIAIEWPNAQQLRVFLSEALHVWLPMAVAVAGMTAYRRLKGSATGEQGVESPE